MRRITRSSPIVHLEIRRIEKPGGLRLVGELDMSTALDLQAALEREVRDGGDITLDLAGVAFMDSSGIQVLVRAARQLQGRGRLILLAPGEAVSRVLEVIRLKDVENIDIVESRS